MNYTKEQLEKHKLVDNYIDFYRLVEEYDLDEGGLAPEQYIQLESILIDFVLQNKWPEEQDQEQKHWKDLATHNERFTD